MISTIIYEGIINDESIEGCFKFAITEIHLYHIKNSAVKSLIASKIKVFVYLISVCVLCIFIMYI